MSSEYILGYGEGRDELAVHLYEVIDGHAHHLGALKLDVRQWDELSGSIGRIVDAHRKYKKESPPDP